MNRIPIINLAIVALLVATFILGALSFVMWSSERPQPITFDAPNVSFRIAGEFGGQGVDEERLIPLIRQACASAEVKSIHLRLNSEGGSALTGERLGSALIDYCKDKEVVAIIEGFCLSACMHVATAADRIIASRYAQVGSIGTILLWTDYSDALAKRGGVERVIASGPAKVRMGEHLSLSEAHVADLARAITASGQAFVAVVRERRAGRLDPGANIEDGGVFAATEALDLGLIDELATIDQVRDRTPGRFTMVPMGAYAGDPPRETRVDRFLKTLEEDN